MTNYLLVCWHLAKMRNTINTLCLLYKASKQTLCVGLEGKRVFEKRGKKESRTYAELLQIKWPKEVKPPPVFSHRINTEPLHFTGLKFSHQFFSEAAVISLLNMCQVSLSLIHFLQRSTNLTKPYHWYTGASGNFNTCWKTINSVSSQCARGKSSTAQ